MTRALSNDLLQRLLLRLCRARAAGRLRRAMPLRMARPVYRPNDEMLVEGYKLAAWRAKRGQTHADQRSLTDAMKKVADESWYERAQCSDWREAR